MHSRSILIGVLVLAFSLTLGLVFFHQDDVARNPGVEPVRNRSVENPEARAADSPARLEPDAPRTTEHASDRAPVAETPATSSEPARFVRLSGRVLDPRGAPLFEVRIFVAPALARRNGVETRTDEHGYFRLDDVRAGRSRWTARRQGLAPHEGEIITVNGNHDLGDIVLEESIVLEGRVLDSKRAPVRGASLRRLRNDANPAEILGEAPEDIVATTDEQGRFHVDELKRGPWSLLIKARNHPDRIEKGETQSAGQVVNGLEFVLDDGALIAGRLVNAPPDLLASVRIMAVPTGDAIVGRVGAGEHIDEQRFLVVPKSAHCAPDGSFAVTELTADRQYRLAAVTGEVDELSRAVTKWVEARSGDLDVELVYQPETALVFQVVDAVTSQPVTDMEVRIGERFQLPLTDEKGQVRRTFPDGRVRFENVLRVRLDEQAELVIEARGYSTLRVGNLRPVEGRDLDLGVLRLEPARVVRVKVVDAATQQPVAGARVAWTGSASSSSLHEGQTDDEGRVQLNSLPGPTAVLSVSHAGHAPYRSGPLDLAREDEQTIALTRGGTVVVVVKDALGAAARGVRIEERRLSAGGDVSEARSDFVPFTDKRGELRFEHLSAGQHRFAIATSTSNAAVVDVSEGGLHTVDLVVPERARLTGRVTEEGRPLSAATLRFSIAVAGDGEKGHVVRTSSDGEYVLENVEPGAWRLRLEHPSRAMPFEREVSIMASAGKLDVELPRTAIEGRVVDENGRGVAGIQVRVEEALATRTSGDAFVVSDADGKYVLRGVKPDVALVVCVRAGDHQPVRTEPLTVAGSETRSGIDLRLVAGAALEVMVSNADGSPRPSFSLQAGWAGEAGHDSPAVIAATDASGRARFTGLRPGRWRVRPRDSPAGTPIAEKLVDVEAGAKNRAELQLR